MFEGNTYQTILNRMLSRVSDKIDKREGAVIFDTHSPTALELQYLYIELERIIAESYGDTASREFLIRRCAERGITPYPASKAVLKGIFTPAETDVAGKRFNLGELNYTVTERLEDGGYMVECESEGAVGNRYLGQLTPVDYVSGLELGELVEVLIPGEDEEDTEKLRERYFKSFDEKAFGGNVRDYKEKVGAIQGVGGVKVTRVWNDDIRPADMVPSDEVKQWYLNVREEAEDKVKTWLDTVFLAAESKKLTVGGTVLITLLNSDHGIASDTLVQNVQDIIDPDENAGEGYGIAPIGHSVLVKSAQGVTVNASLSILFEEGYELERLQSSIEQVIKDYLSELRQAWAESRFLVVRTARIEAGVLGIKGILDIRETKVNGASDNLVLGKYQVPVFGEAQVKALGGEAQ